MTRVDFDDPALARLLAVLDRDGELARVVGGAVRDALLGQPVYDIDVATTAVPPIVIRRCQDEGWRVIPTGIDHGTVTVLVDGQPYEVTTLREDVETDGRHAVVHFGRDFALDARRRDFTINALSAGPDGAVHDSVGGLADLTARRVRFIGDADRRIAEDRLRILRFFRFHARFGTGEPDAEGLAAAIRGRDGLRQLSAERVRAELLKLLLAPGAAATVRAMSDAGLTAVLLGGVVRPPALERLIGIEERSPPDALRRLAAIAVFVADDAVRLAERLRLSRAEAARLFVMATAADGLHRPPDARGARALIYRLGTDGARDATWLAWARDAGSAWKAVAALVETWRAPPLPFTGAALVRAGHAAGPALGRIIAEAERRWIAADFPTKSKAQAALLAEAIAAVER